MKIKVNYILRYKDGDKYCSTEHIDITEDDLLEYIKVFRKPSTDELYIEDGIEIEGLIIWTQ